MPHPALKWFVALAVIVTALGLGAGVGRPQHASAASAVVDSTSCGLNGASWSGPNSYCSFDLTGTDVVVGPNSCNVANACLLLGDGVTINAGGSSADPGSCNGDAACAFAGAAGGAATIGNHSCNGNTTCFDAGIDGSATIGDNSCNGDFACELAGASGSATIGDNSCNVDFACLDTSAAAIGDCQDNGADTGCIIIAKTASPHGATDFSFSASLTYASCAPDTDPTAFTLVDDGSGANSESCAGVPISSAYTITETPTAGWTLTGISCSDVTNDATMTYGGSANSTFQAGDTAANVTLATAGDIVTCTFTNTENSATFTVSKAYVGGGSEPDATISLSCDSGTPSPTSAPAGTGGDAVFTVAGIDTSTTCTATEDAVAGYHQTATTCDGVSVDANQQDAACTITNTLNTATVTVHKHYAGGGDMPDATISLTCDSGTPSPTSATAGTASNAVFTVTAFEDGANCNATEAPVPNYHQTGNSCNLTIQPDAALDCTITNAADPGSIMVQKSVSMGTNDQSFSFVSSIDGCSSFSLADDGVQGDNRTTCDGLAVGTYTVQEVNLPANWSVDSINCRGGSVQVDTAAGKATIQVGAGENVVCVFIDGYYDPSADVTPYVPSPIPWTTLPVATATPTAAPAPTATGPGGQVAGVGTIVPPNTGDGGLVGTSSGSSTSGLAPWLAFVAAMSLATGLVVTRKLSR